MPTLVLAPRYTEDSIALWRAAGRLGWEVERLTRWEVPDSLRGMRDVAIYGEPLFVAAVADDLGIAVLEPTPSWLSDLPEEHLRRKVIGSTIGEARRIDHPAFIKPAVDKSFPAMVYSKGLEIAAQDLLPDQTPVLISEPVQFTVEYRCFVLDRTVRTSSVYWRGDVTAQAEDGSWPSDASEDAQALEMADQVLSDDRVTVPAAFVLDVGHMEGRGWGVIEANSAWGAGLYGCDPAVVLDVVRRSCVALSQVDEADRKWVLQRTWEQG
jgi:hypothetical protein